MSLRLRRALAAGLAVPLALVAGCSGGSSGSESDTVKIGFMSSLSGVYQSAGEDMRDGFQLYVDLNDGQLGGRTVDLVVVDEGDGPDTARPAAERLVRQDQVAAMAGVLNAASFVSIIDLINENEIPLVGANARPTQLGPDDVEWIWTTSWLNKHAGQAIAPYMYENIDGPVWAIGPDNQGGYDQIGGFVDAYTQLGGQLANPDGEPTWAPFPTTTDFIPYLSQIAASDAAAVYAFLAGEMAINFVTQYAQSEAADIPLYGAYLTEGPVLDAQGDAAEGIYNVLNYSPDLDNSANRAFVAEWSARHDRTPTTFAMGSWDAAQVLDLAIGSIDGEVTPAAINGAMAEIGQIDSPRGPWAFSEELHAPVQSWYLRVVARDGARLSNVVVEDLATLQD